MSLKKYSHSSTTSPSNSVNINGLPPQGSKNFLLISAPVCLKFWTASCPLTSRQSTGPDSKIPSCVSQSCISPIYMSKYSVASFLFKNKSYIPEISYFSRIVYIMRPADLLKIAGGFINTSVQLSSVQWAGREKTMEMRDWESWREAAKKTMFWWMSLPYLPRIDDLSASLGFSTPKIRVNIDGSFVVSISRPIETSEVRCSVDPILEAIS